MGYLVEYSFGMKLEQLSEGITSHLYAERYCGEGSRTYTPFANYSNVSRRYQSTSPYSSYELPSLLLPSEQVEIYAGGLDSDLAEEYVKAPVGFYIHPELFFSDDPNIIRLRRQFPEGEPIEVTPTGSARSVFRLSDSNLPPHYLKLNLHNRRISRQTRPEKRDDILEGMSISQDLSFVSNDKFAYLAEVGGVVISELNWAYAIREYTPRPQVREARFMIPYFSLYGHDLNQPDDLPLLFQLVERSHEDPESYIREKIINPVIECWCNAATERGILLCSHGQNVLLELDENFNPTRIVHRDLDKPVDLRVRRERNLGKIFSTSIIGTHISLEDEKYGEIYDWQMGHHLLDFIASLSEEYYGINPKYLRDGAISVFRQFYPNPDLFFPKTMHFFADEHVDDPKIEDTGLKPVWRA